MTATPTIPGRDDSGPGPNTKGPFQKCVTVLQDSTGEDYNNSNPIPTKVINLG